jgi:hypothetical protein
VRDHYEEWEGRGGEASKKNESDRGWSPKNYRFKRRATAVEASNHAISFLCIDKLSR